MLRPFLMKPVNSDHGGQVGGLKSLHVAAPLKVTVALLLPGVENVQVPEPVEGGIGGGPGVPAVTNPVATAENTAVPAEEVDAVAGVRTIAPPPDAEQVPAMAAPGTSEPLAVRAVTVIAVVLPAVGTRTEFGETCSVATWTDILMLVV